MGKKFMDQIKKHNEQREAEAGNQPHPVEPTKAPDGHNGTDQGKGTPSSSTDAAKREPKRELTPAEKAVQDELDQMPTRAKSKQGQRIPVPEVEYIAGKIIYSLPHVVKLIGVSNRTLLTYLKEGKLEGRKIAGRWRISKESVERFWNPTPADRKQ